MPYFATLSTFGSRVGVAAALLEIHHVRICGVCCVDFGELINRGDGVQFQHAFPAQHADAVSSACLGVRPRTWSCFAQ